MRIEKSNMYHFEEILTRFEPMISAAIRKCKIYKNHEHYRQTARIALWQAWQKYDSRQGDFTPYAYRCIHGSILDELKREIRYETHYQPEEDSQLEIHLPMELDNEIASKLEGLLNILEEQDRQFLIDYYIRGFSYEELSVKYGTSIVALKRRRGRIIKRVRENNTVKI